jgi:hypothetical protein
MTLLAKLLSDINKESKRPKPKLQLFLMKQEKEGLEKRKKMYAKKMQKLQKAQKSPVKSVSTKKQSPPPKLELTKAQKSLHKKVFGKKKGVYVSPVKSKSPKNVKGKSPKSNSPKSTKSNSPKSVRSNSPKSVISNNSFNYN